MSEDEATEKLKRLVARCKECKFATCENCEINWNEVQAIETILDENTKLSEEIIENICKGAEEDIMEEYRQQLKNSISKDKIRDKIKELENQLKKIYDDEDKEGRIDMSNLFTLKTRLRDYKELLKEE